MSFFVTAETFMDRFAELILRLLEVQSGGGPRSPELVAEDKQLLEGLERRYLAGLSLRRSNFVTRQNQYSPAQSSEVYVDKAA
jgi:hypothetical protein